MYVFIIYTCKDLCYITTYLMLYNKHTVYMNTVCVYIYKGRANNNGQYIHYISLNTASSMYVMQDILH